MHEAPRWARVRDGSRHVVGTDCPESLVPFQSSTLETNHQIITNVIKEAPRCYSLIDDGRPPTKISHERKILGLVDPQMTEITAIREAETGTVVPMQAAV